jgi:hypothetical protein
LTTDRAFVAITSDEKTIVTWGDSEYGGNLSTSLRFVGQSDSLSVSDSDAALSSNTLTLTKKVVFAVTTKAAVFLLLEDWTLIAWGKLQGKSISSLSSTLSAVQRILFSLSSVSSLSTSSSVLDMKANEHFVVIQLATKEFIVFSVDGYQHHKTC